MPSYVNVGAWVGSGTMVDTWATVGSCAQIGTDVHLCGGVGIGGVLEPLQASPVIVEDGAFVGSRCIVVEGVRVGREAVLGANVVLTASTPIIDVRGDEPVELRGEVPAARVVIPGTRKKKFPAGDYRVPCALIIGERTPRPTARRRSPRRCASTPSASDSVDSAWEPAGTGPRRPAATSARASSGRRPAPPSRSGRRGGPRRRRPRARRRRAAP